MLGPYHGCYIIVRLLMLNIQRWSVRPDECAALIEEQGQHRYCNRQAHRILGEVVLDAILVPKICCALIG